MTYFDCPFVDVDEWRSHPVPHRYVHGGFTGTDTRFSFYFPEPDRYEGRLLQFLQGGVGGDESTAIGPHPSGADIGFAFHCGAYLVESNQGHIGLDLSGDPRVMNHAASIAAARYSKEIAAQMYGAPPHHAYVYGPSGGGLRTIACAEHGDGFYDGAVPYVAGGTNYGALLVKMSAIANVIDLFTEAQLDAIGDATDVGGHGNPFAGLDTPRREALAALYRSGFPRRAERQIRTHGQALMIWAWDALTITTFDPDYFERFWTEPGYAGADGLLADRLVAIETTVGALCDAATVLANTDSAETGAG
ncbi:MAG TPA: hypothetical protein VF183_09710, partial [Acidimicrobiales bacterium]